MRCNHKQYVREHLGITCNWRIAKGTYGTTRQVSGGESAEQLSVDAEQLLVAVCRSSCLSTWRRTAAAAGGTAGAACRLAMSGGDSRLGPPDGAPRYSTVLTASRVYRLAGSLFNCLSCSARREDGERRVVAASAALKSTRAVITSKICQDKCITSKGQQQQQRPQQPQHPNTTRNPNTHNNVRTSGRPDLRQAAARWGAAGVVVVARGRSDTGRSQPGSVPNGGGSPRRNAPMPTPLPKNDANVAAGGELRGV
jgi:hypothetical protein